jgi:hypothetical protein
MDAVARRLALAAPVAIAWSLAGPAAWADDAGSSEAEALFRRGRASAAAGDHASACVAFAESLRLEWAPGTLLNLADCEERTGQTARAWADFVRLERAVPPADARKDLAHQRAAALAPRLARMTVAFATDAVGPASPPAVPWARTPAPIWISGGTGVVSLGVAASLAASEHGPGDDTAFAAALGLGVLGLTVAATLWLTARTDAAPRAAGLVVAPSGVGASW